MTRLNCHLTECDGIESKLVSQLGCRRNPSLTNHCTVSHAILPSGKRWVGCFDINDLYQLEKCWRMLASWYHRYCHLNGLAQYCGISSLLAMEMPCLVPSHWCGQSNVIQHDSRGNLKGNLCPTFWSALRLLMALHYYMIHHIHCLVHSTAVNAMSFLNTLYIAFTKELCGVIWEYFVKKIVHDIMGLKVY